MDMITLYGHDDAQDAQQTTTDIKYWSRRARGDMKLPDEMFPSGYLYRHALGQCQSKRGRSNQVLRKDTSNSAPPLMHDFEDFIVSHQVKHTPNTIRQHDRRSRVLNALINILHHRSSNSH